MGDKSVQKKRYIAEKAREVFSKRGYKDVTMKDIVEACGISRGGLYLYYANTKELFEDVLELETQEAKDVFAAGVKKDSTPGDLLLLYLDTQKKAILKKKNNLTMAVYEYMFANQKLNQEIPVRKQFDENVEKLEQLITEGVKQEWMVCDDPLLAARNITYTLEGLKLAAQTTGVSEQTIDSQIDYMLGTLGLAVES